MTTDQKNYDAGLELRYYKNMLELNEQQLEYARAKNDELSLLITRADSRASKLQAQNDMLVNKFIDETAYLDRIRHLESLLYDHQDEIQELKHLLSRELKRNRELERGYTDGVLDGRPALWDDYHTGG